MKIKQIGVLALCLIILGGLLAVPALALDSGVYTGSVTTSYYNPDTGNIDDGGTANAALGEGMCRSATAETALVEIDADGNIWITIRLLLQSSCKNITFYARTAYDSYAQVSYDIMAEDSGNDSIDYRFKASSAGVKLKCTMYVTPMGRDVLWYLYLDTSTLASGSGDFVVSIDTGDTGDDTPAETEMPAETAEATPASTPTPAVEKTPEASVSPEAPEESSEPAETETVAVKEDADTIQTEAPEESDEPTPEVSESVMVEADDVETEAAEDDEAASDETEAAVEEKPVVGIGVEGEYDEDTSDETAETDIEKTAGGGIRAGAITGIIIAIVIIGGIIVIVLRRKK